MYAHRTARCVAGCVNTQRRCGGTMEPLDLAAHQPQSTGRVPMEVDQTRAVLGFSSEQRREGQIQREGQEQEHG